MACFAANGKALRRRHRHNGAATVATGKTEKMKEENGDGTRALMAARKQEEAMPRPSPRQRKVERGHERAWKPKEGRRR